MKFRQDVGDGRFVCEPTRVGASPRGQAGGWARAGGRAREVCKVRWAYKTEEWLVQLGEDETGRESAVG